MLEDRDPEYQLLAVRGLLSNAKRVLAATKDEGKIHAIQSGIQVLEEFLRNFVANNMMQYQRAYLPYELVRKFPPSENAMQREFLECYGSEKVNGNYKQLRSMFPQNNYTETAVHDTSNPEANQDQQQQTAEAAVSMVTSNVSWDVIRNRQIAKILSQLTLSSPESEGAAPPESEQNVNGGTVEWFDKLNGAPTRQHLQLIYWAYSPQPEELHAYLNRLKTAEKRPHEATVPSDKATTEEKSSDNGLTPDKKLKMS